MSAIHSITDPLDLKRAMNSAARLVERSKEARFDILSVCGWSAVPVESSSHLSTENQAALVLAFRASGQSAVWAVALEPLQEATLVYRVDVTLEGLKQFNSTCSHFNFALIPEDESSVVVCTTDDYLIVAGKDEFVIQALGASVTESFQRFRQFSSDPGWPKEAQAFFRSVDLALSEDYARAPPRTKVRVPR